MSKILLKIQTTLGQFCVNAQMLYMCKIKSCLTLANRHASLRRTLSLIRYKSLNVNHRNIACILSNINASDGVTHQCLPYSQ